MPASLLGAQPFQALVAADCCGHAGRCHRLADTRSHSAASVSKTPDSLPHTRAAQGDAHSQLQLGIRYAEGDGVIQNDKEAAKWFALAAKQGLAEAQYHYGLALLRGRGVVQDYRAAFNWIEKPAQAWLCQGAIQPGRVVSLRHRHADRQGTRLSVVQPGSRARRGRRSQGARQSGVAVEARADRRHAGRGTAHEPDATLCPPHLTGRARHHTLTLHSRMRMRAVRIDIQRPQLM